MEVGCGFDDFGDISLQEASRLSIFASVSPTRRQQISLKRIKVGEAIKIPPTSNFYYDNRSFYQKRNLVPEAVKQKRRKELRKRHIGNIVARSQSVSRLRNSNSKVILPSLGRKSPTSPQHYIKELFGYARKPKWTSVKYESIRDAILGRKLSK